MRKSNPALQCSVCGQWKRLVIKTPGDEENMQRFYSCCIDKNGNEVVHSKQICTDCCKEKCPDRLKQESLNENL